MFHVLVPAVVGPKLPDAYPSGVLAGPAQLVDVSRGKVNVNNGA